MKRVASFKSSCTYCLPTIHITQRGNHLLVWSLQRELLKQPEVGHKCFEKRKRGWLLGGRRRPSACPNLFLPLQADGFFPVRPCLMFLHDPYPLPRSRWRPMNLGESRDALNPLPCSRSNRATSGCRMHSLS